MEDRRKKIIYRYCLVGILVIGLCLVCILFFDVFAKPKNLQSYALDADFVEYIKKEDINLKDVNILEFYNNMKDKDSKKLCDNGNIKFSYDRNKIEISIQSSGKIILPQDSSNLFSGFINLQSLYFNGAVQTQNVTDMSNMFYGCKEITALSFFGFDTKNVIDMSNMFYGCTKLNYLDINSFCIAENCNVQDFLKDTTNLTTIISPKTLNKETSFCNAHNYYSALAPQEKYLIMPQNTLLKVGALLCVNLDGGSVVNNNGWELQNDKLVKVLLFDKKIEQLPQVTKTGFEFVHFCTQDQSIILKTNNSYTSDTNFVAIFAAV